MVRFADGDAAGRDGGSRHSARDVDTTPASKRAACEGIVADMFPPRRLGAARIWRMRFAWLRCLGEPDSLVHRKRSLSFIDAWAWAFKDDSHVVSCVCVCKIAQVLFGGARDSSVLGGDRCRQLVWPLRKSRSAPARHRRDRVAATMLFRIVLRHSSGVWVINCIIIAFAAYRAAR